MARRGTPLDPQLPAMIDATQPAPGPSAGLAPRSFAASLIPYDTNVRAAARPGSPALGVAASSAPAHAGRTPAAGPQQGLGQQDAQVATVDGPRTMSPGERQFDPGSGGSVGQTSDAVAQLEPVTDRAAAQPDVAGFFDVGVRGEIPDA